ncbi:TPA: VWA domain-containing protein [Clostridioides difficile]|nr:VWA domain-containing protein [Clostridioides difficile]
MKNIFNFKNKKNHDEPNENLGMDLESAKTKVDLRKKTISNICLTKKEFNGINNVKFNVIVVIDASGSTSNLYINGTIQNVINRLLPMALKFDDDGELKLYLFNHKFFKEKNVTTDNFFNYVKENDLYNKYVYGGTNYSSIMKAIINFTMNTKKNNNPTYVIFITDGDNSDKEEAKKAIIEASDKPIFWQFVGVGNEKFKFLELLDNIPGRVIDNANFFSLKDINEISDTELYENVMKELPIWLKEAKDKKILTL